MILNDCVDGVSCSKQEHAMNNRVSLLITEGALVGGGGKMGWWGGQPRALVLLSQQQYHQIGILAP